MKSIKTVPQYQSHESKNFDIVLFSHNDFHSDKNVLFSHMPGLWKMPKFLMCAPYQGEIGQEYIFQYLTERSTFSNQFYRLINYEKKNVPVIFLQNRYSKYLK